MLNLASLQTPLSLTVLDCLPDAVVVLNQHGQPLLCNQRANEFLPPYLSSLWSSEGASPYRVMDCHHCPLSADQLPLQRIRAGEILDNEEFLLVHRHSAQRLWLALSGGPCADGGDVAGVISVRDISSRKQQEADLQRHAFHDELTGLPNRNALIDHINALLAEEPRPETLALLYIDLDRFKDVNDDLGHRVGNQLLQQLGERLRQPSPTPAMIARLGGDDFAVLCEHLTHPEEAITLAKHLRQLITQPFHLQGHNLGIDASIGIAPGATHYRHAEDWLRDADTAMYQIKDFPDRHWCVFDLALQAQRSERRQAEVALREALDRHELLLYYQPIVTITTQAIIGFEALVRWQHPEKGLLMPGEFISLAEDSGLIIPMSWWVLEEACRQMQAWTKAYPGMAHFTISVNMSSKQFFQANLVEKVQEILTQTEFDPHRLKLEITEGVLIDHSDSIIATLEQLRDLGIRLAVDDFGTGYSSLSYLHRFPFDCLKIDRSFIENADQDFEKLEILQSVVRLAWNLGLDVVAEGVETHRHYAQLKALRCESGQGYLFSRPMPPDAVESILSQGSCLGQAGSPPPPNKL